MTMPVIPHWLVLTGMGGNLLAGVVFTVQGNPAAWLFAAAAVVNVYTLAKGGRKPDPPEPEPLGDEWWDRRERERIRQRRLEETRAHADWDRQFRILTPPGKDAVWKRRTYEITDFNN